MLQPPADHTLRFSPLHTHIYYLQNLCYPHEITTIQEKYISLVQQQDKDTVQEAKQLAGGADEVEEVRNSWLKLGRLLPSSEHSRRIKENGMQKICSSHHNCLANLVFIYEIVLCAVAWTPYAFFQYSKVEWQTEMPCSSRFQKKR